MNINKLKSLVAAAKESEHLYEQQAAAMEFTLTYGERIIALVEAGQAMRHAAGEVIQVDYYGGYERRLKESVAAWDAATKEEEV